MCSYIPLAIPLCFLNRRLKFNRFLSPGLTRRNTCPLCPTSSSIHKNDIHLNTMVPVSLCDSHLTQTQLPVICLSSTALIRSMRNDTKTRVYFLHLACTSTQRRRSSAGIFLARFGGRREEVVWDRSLLWHSFFFYVCGYHKLYLPCVTHLSPCPSSMYTACLDEVLQNIIH